MNRSDSSVPVYSLLLADVVGFLVAWGPGTIAWCSTVFFVRKIWVDSHWYYFVFLSPILLATSFIFTVFIFRILLPRLKPGVYDVADLAIKTWFMHFQLVNSIHVSGLMPLIYCTYLTRFLYFRAMGAKIAYGVHLSIYTRFREFPLIKIGSGSSLSADTHISCHTHVGEKLLLGAVEIGERCFIGMDTVIGPKTKIGSGCWIGTGNRLLMDRIPDNTTIRNFEFSDGNPAKLKARDENSRKN